MASRIMDRREINKLIIDVSVPLSPDTPVWPGAPKPEFLQKKTSLEGSNEKTDSHISLIPHCGTHIDAPLHFAKGGAAVHAISFDMLMGPCRVFEHQAEHHIGMSDLAAMGFIPVRRAIFKTRNSGHVRNGTLNKEYLSLLPEAVDHLIRSGVELLGVDGFSIGPYGEISDRNHIAFCGAGGIIIEMLDLAGVKAGEYQLIALPIKLVGIEASPARVVLIRRGELHRLFCESDKS